MAYTQYTLGDLQQRLQERVESVPFWTAEEATDALNEGLLLMNLLTGYWRRTVTITTTPNHDYPLPATLGFQSRVLYDGKVMEPVSLHAMNNGRPNWRGDVVGDTGVPTRPYAWIPLGLQLFAIWPADAGGHTLTVEGVSATPQLVNPTDYVDLSEASFNALLSIALLILTFKEGSERFTAAQSLLPTFLTHCAELNGQLKASALFRRLLGVDAGKRETRGITTAYPGQTT